MTNEELTRELNSAALRIEAFHGHGTAARLMREAAVKMRELMPVEAPVEDVAERGEE